MNIESFLAQNQVLRNKYRSTYYFKHYTMAKPVLLDDKVNVEYRSTANRKNTICFRRIIQPKKQCFFCRQERSKKLELSGWAVSFGFDFDTHINYNNA